METASRLESLFRPTGQPSLRLFFCFGVAFAWLKAFFKWWLWLAFYQNLPILWSLFSINTFFGTQDVQGRDGIYGGGLVPVYQGWRSAMRIGAALILLCSCANFYFFSIPLCSCCAHLCQQGKEWIDDDGSYEYKCNFTYMYINVSYIYKKNFNA